MTRRHTGDGQPSKEDAIYSRPEIFWPLFGGALVLIIAFCAWCLHRGPNRPLWACFSRRAHKDEEHGGGGVDEKRASRAPTAGADRRRSAVLDSSADLLGPPIGADSGRSSLSSHRKSVLVKTRRGSASASHAASPTPSSPSAKYPPSPASTFSVGPPAKLAYPPLLSPASTSTLVLGPAALHSPTPRPASYAVPPVIAPRQMYVQPPIMPASSDGSPVSGAGPAVPRTSLDGLAASPIAPSSRRKRVPSFNRAKSYPPPVTPESAYSPSSHAASPSMNHGYAYMYSAVPEPWQEAAAQSPLPPSSRPVAHNSFAPSDTTWYSSASSAYRPSSDRGVAAPARVYFPSVSSSAGSGAAPFSPPLSTGQSSPAASPNRFFQHALAQSRQSPEPSTPAHAPSRSVDDPRALAPQRPMHHRSASSPLATAVSVEADAPGDAPNCSPRLVKQKLRKSVMLGKGGLLGAAGVNGKAPPVPIVADAAPTEERTGYAV